MSSSLAVRLSVVCSGKDAAGKEFEERTRTTAIFQDGGQLLTQQKLQAGARLELRLAALPDRAAEIIVQEALKSGDPNEWVFNFAKPQREFWGVRFPEETISSTAPAATAVSEMSERLVLLAAHADDHMRYCLQELEVVRQRFTRELQGALDAGARQLQQVARSTMQTTFRSLLEELARRAEETAAESLTRLRKEIDDTKAAQTKYIDEETTSRENIFQERLEKQARHFTARLEQLQADGERAIQEAVQKATADFQAGCAEMLADLLRSAESRRAARPAAARRP